MHVATSPGPDPMAPLVSSTAFQITMWALCILATLFLATRVALRISTTEKLMVGDWILVSALPVVYIAFALLHSALGALYSIDDAAAFGFADLGSAATRLTAAIEMLWIAIYLAKLCYLASYKFHDTLSAYINVHLTRYYWATVGLCSVGFIFTVIQPIVLCPNLGWCAHIMFLDHAEYLGHCDYIPQARTVRWEMAVTAIDIATDILVLLIPTLVIRMANLARPYAIINCGFKSLSIFAMAVATTRLALQYDVNTHRIQYVTLAFLLVIEIAVAIISASVSGYRVAVLEHLAARARKTNVPLQSGTHGEQDESHLHRSNNSRAGLFIPEPGPAG